ncbi:MAG: PaaI family thioesterase [Chloroflexota bacterium]|nr:PaaI family thioesterase [Chloroflexota bacterium]
MTWKKQPNSRYCFICGIHNPVGLNLAFWQDGEKVVSRVELGVAYQGYPGIVHGGIVTALLDEVMGRAIIGLGGDFAFTAKMELKFRQPAPLNTPLVVSGWLTRQRSQWFTTEGELIVEESGEVVVRATATFARLPDEQVEEMSDALDFWEVVEDRSTHQPPVEWEDEG